MIRRWPGFLLIVVLLVLWEIASAQKWIDPVSMPKVSTIALSWVESMGGGPLLMSIGPTLWRIGVGFGLATLVAVPLGIGSAAYLSEIAPGRIRKVCSFLLEPEAPDEKPRSRTS